MSAGIVIEGFHRTDEDGRSVSFCNAISDPTQLSKELRSQGVCAPGDAAPVVVMLKPEGEKPGNCRGTVAVAGDDDNALRTIELAIEALEAVRSGLREAGHRDHQPSSS